MVIQDYGEDIKIKLLLYYTKKLARTLSTQGHVLKL